MRVFKNILFFVILFAGLIGMSYNTEAVLQKNENFVQPRNKSAYQISREPAKSIDMVVVGDSLSYTSVSPMELWENYGITSFVCGQSGQKIQEMYDMLKNVFRTQSPKLVVLETHVFFKEQKGFSAVKNSLEELGNNSCSLLRGHDVWKSYIIGKQYTEYQYKGFSFRCNVAPYQKGDYMIKSDKVKELPELTKVYMNKILKLCEQHNTEILLFSTPSPLNYNYARHNGLENYAKVHNVRYLDMNLKLQETGINWQTDSLDKGDHLNLRGARKVTAYLGKYLNAGYDLPDHRGEKKYDSWNVLNKKYQKEAKECLKKMQ